MTPFEVYVMFNALKMHFADNSTYDFIKYHGKVKRDPNKFDALKERFHFLNVVRKYQPDEIQDFLIANVFHNPKVWSGFLVSDAAKDIYLEYKRKRQSITYLFEEDLRKIMESYKFEDLFSIKDGQNPIILNLAYTKQINLETFIILNNILSFFPRLTKELNDDIIWPSFRKRCEKIAPFLSIDKAKLTKIMVEECKPTTHT